jgi:hypothetical protein
VAQFLTLKPHRRAVKFPLPEGVLMEKGEGGRGRGMETLILENSQSADQLAAGRVQAGEPARMMGGEIGRLEILRFADQLAPDSAFVGPAVVMLHPGVAVQLPPQQPSLGPP